MPSNSPYIVSSPLPTLADLQAEIDELNKQLAATPSNIFTGGGRRAGLERQLRAKMDLLTRVRTPSADGTTPAPEGPAILAPRIETPKIGLDDLKILLPR